MMMIFLDFCSFLIFFVCCLVFGFGFGFDAEQVAESGRTAFGCSRDALSQGQEARGGPSPDPGLFVFLS